MKDGDHVGTRMRHIADLYEYWNEGLEIMRNSEKIMVSESGKVQTRKLENALELLDYYLENDYSPYNTYSKEINALRHSSRIEGGRGTDLRHDLPEAESGKDPNN